ncbi:hypothetical protein GF391_00975, partial [Candidatus Uhrbacteria bacterium]|nr:hypothetical protein [Candidatus Uhrbacteria bacterium]
MPLNATSASAAKKRIGLLIWPAIFFLFLSAPINTAQAACCRCTHQDIDGTFCIQKDVGNCENLAKHNDEFTDADCKLETKGASCQKISEGGICINKPMP